MRAEVRRARRGTAAVAVLVGLLIWGGPAASAPPPDNVLKIELAVDIGPVDPALSYYVPAWTIEYATCAKLLNYPDRNAPVGGLLEPEVATGMPMVSADGKTYTFQLHDDFFFSPPSNELVTPAHFKYALERALNRQMSSPSQPFFDDIVGATDVIAGNTNLLTGVVAEGSTLRITLVAPAPDFLARLTMPFTCPLPLSTPIEPNGIGAPVPSAGPYYIESRTPNQAIVVKENPNYTGDRPHHFDEIHYGIGLPLETIKLNIDAGETDYGDIPPAAHSEVGFRCGPGSPRALVGRQCYFFYPSPTVRYLAMNHDRKLFGDDPDTGPGLDRAGNVELKQAVNFAIDRTAMMLQHGDYAGAPTDQYLPYGMAGFRDADIYPSSPDLDQARALAAGHTHDGVGVLWCSDRAPAPQICQIVQANLRAIGLEMTIELLPRATQFELAGRRGAAYDMTLEGWHMDYFDPFDFLFLLDGTLLRPANNLNFAYFDDPVYNDRIHEANRLQGAARMTAFGDLDVDIARDAAPWAPYMVPNDRLYFSDRIGCQTYVPPFTISLGALCVRPLIEIGDASIVEGNSGSAMAEFTVTVSEAAAADYPFTVEWETIPGSAVEGDFSPASGSLPFDTGERSKTISIAVNGDASHEGDERFSVVLSNATKGTIVAGQGTGTIRNDDEPPAGAPESVSASLSPGGSLGTDVEGNGATPTDPLETSVQTPVGGVVTIEETAEGTPVGGYSILGHQVSIQAPTATPSNPLILEFRLDGSLASSVADLQIFRNGTLILDCAAAGATPDPCVAERSLAGDDARMIVRTSQASRWNFGYAQATPPPPPPPPSPPLPPPPPPPPPTRPPAQVRCIVPLVKGKTVPAARAALSRARCALGRVSRAYSGRVRKSRIISQSRRAASRHPRGTRVNVVVSRGRRR
jgi:peptide/nickel transport system substrate-binding protein